MSRTHDETTQQILAVLADMAARIDAIGARIEAALSPPAAPAPIEVKQAVELPKGFDAADMESFLQATASRCPHALSSLAASQPANFGGKPSPTDALDQFAEPAPGIGIKPILTRRLLGEPLSPYLEDPVRFIPGSALDSFFKDHGAQRQTDKAARLGLGYQTGRFDKERRPADLYKATAEAMLAQSQPAPTKDAENE